MDQVEHIIPADEKNADSVKFGDITVDQLKTGYGNIILIEQGAGTDGGQDDNIHVTFSQLPKLIEALENIKTLEETRKANDAIKVGDLFSKGPMLNPVYKVIAIGCAYGERFQNDYEVYVTIERVRDDNHNAVYVDRFGEHDAEIYKLSEFRRYYKERV